jgi:hypothetical protein
MVEVSNPGQSRASYYDRNPDPKGGQYDNSVGTHTSTTRISITVTSGKKAWVERLVAALWKDGASAATGRCTAVWQWTPNGGAAVVLARASIYQNALGTSDRDNASFQGYMGPGDTLVCSTIDTYADGTVFHSHAVKYTEFDSS